MCKVACPLYLIEAFLTSPVDTTQLQELKTASSLVEAPNIDTKPKIEEVEKLFKNITDIKERNTTILKAIEKGYSQHMIAKVLGISQQAVFGLRGVGNELSLSPDPYSYSSLDPVFKFRSYSLTLTL